MRGSELNVDVWKLRAQWTKPEPKQPWDVGNGGKSAGDGRINAAWALGK